MEMIVAAAFARNFICRIAVGFLLIFNSLNLAKLRVEKLSEISFSNDVLGYSSLRRHQRKSPVKIIE